jgi:hypothetical protein
LRRDPIIVPVRRRNLHILCGFLTVVWIVAVAGGYAVGVWLQLVFVALLIATVLLWLRLTRNPPRLEISEAAIRRWHEGKPGVQELDRGSGELYIRRSDGKNPQPYLSVRGSDQEGIPLDMFDQDEVVRAAEALGWRFT